MIEKRKFHIGGHWVDPVEARDHQVINPATEEPVAVISLGSAADVDRAVDAATAAFRSWSETCVDERATLLERIIEIYERRSDEMDEAIRLEMGAPVDFAREQQTPSGTGHLQATLEALKTHEFERPSPRGGSLLRHEPIGVCGLITPWNWPINQVAAKVAPALAAGCTMVLKPSEIAPLSALLFAEILHKAGCPAGVFNLVNGDGPGVGAAMSAHPGIDMMSFTGSTRAGVAVTQNAAATVKRVALELGGKSPNLLFADADLETAIRFSLESCFSNSGQSCDAPTRLLVERSAYEGAVTAAERIAAETTVGDPAEEGDHIGPVISNLQYERIQGHIERGIADGARLVAGGPGRPAGFEKGYFVKPTVFADVTNQMSVARNEIFGPVLVMIPFETEDEAIEMANDTPYGLAAYIQTGSPERAKRVSRKLRAGSVYINGAAPDWDVPFGGYKQSGNGREYGEFGLEDFLELKSITG
ncbi:aldehyde dehydrogenase family protein [Roseibium album]|uniref:3-succinoylsemialdehyde-pyridine dehydrogenase n=1 Tax=Roseibium album TaxID=311410 RepID=A0A0M6ZAI3_9HYPH|nr:aldehyde dehydrogenase family protein [Roseibium album]CTQ59291.1 3-succinoylsemialdehyde-pyridine dehydrogenase [Roseibium album]CTQ64670.1 3-succinoylsemialdehyde-pyridine dehydrogenase [Roseibium album]CTQ74559.1 3-succinoylsemialdehyde-pyridine dehydrogenase [Roseibium album]